MKMSIEGVDDDHNTTYHRLYMENDCSSSLIFPSVNVIICTSPFQAVDKMTGTHQDIEVLPTPIENKP